MPIHLSLMSKSLLVALTISSLRSRRSAFWMLLLSFPASSTLPAFLSAALSSKSFLLSADTTLPFRVVVITGKTAEAPSKTPRHSASPASLPFVRPFLTTSLKATFNFSSSVSTKPRLACALTSPAANLSLTLATKGK